MYDDLIIYLYLILHLPAFIMLIIGFAIYKKYKKSSKYLFVLAGIYFLIGAGICGNMLI